jgi:cell wall-associated NlpC family hydrolase
VRRSTILLAALFAALLTTSPALADTEPATPAAARVMDELTRIEQTLRDTRYSHQLRVRRWRGEYAFDCSGMVQWVLGRTARRSMLDLDDDQRPLAIHFVQRIERAPTDRSRGGWRRLRTIDDVRPGDVFAWRRPERFRSRNTGHVGFVIGAPRRVGDSRVYLIRVADASRYTHQDDTRPWPGPGGFGRGTIAFVTDELGRPIGYAWAGLHSRGYRETDVVFGRVGR